MRSFQTPLDIIQLAERAASDERRHTELCAELVADYGPPPQPVGDGTPAEIAPSSLSARQKLLYEVVAACCITETESTSVLTTLLQSSPRPTVQKVLQQIARDEVLHSRLGWAYLARERESSDVSFLSELIPAMLAGTVPENFFDAPAGPYDSPALLEHGVLPHSRKQGIFAASLDEVIFPGLESFGVDSQPARRWLASRRREGARLSGL